MNTTTPNDGDFLGVTHFAQAMYLIKPAWSLVALSAPIESVTRAFVDFRKAKRVVRDVAMKLGDPQDILSTHPCIVDIPATGWSVLFRSVGFVNFADIDAVTEEAEALSATLKTRALAFIGDPVSFSVGYSLYDCGAQVERAEWRVGSDCFTLWISALREQPTLDHYDISFADAVFRDHGIYIPACYPCIHESRHCLIAEPCSRGAIARADIVEIAEPPPLSFEQMVDKMRKKSAQTYPGKK